MDYLIAGGCFKIEDMSGIEVVKDKSMSPLDLRRSIHSVLLVRTKRRNTEGNGMADDGHKRQKIQNPVDQNQLKSLENSSAIVSPSKAIQVPPSIFQFADSPTKAMSFSSLD